jgi:hypothetical protein
MSIARWAWTVLVVAALFGGFRALRDSLPGRWLVFALLCGRTLLPLVSGLASEPRYMLEAIAACFTLAALEFGTLLGAPQSAGRH